MNARNREQAHALGCATAFVRRARLTFTKYGADVDICRPLRMKMKIGRITSSRLKSGLGSCPTGTEGVCDRSFEVKAEMKLLRLFGSIDM